MTVLRSSAPGMETMENEYSILIASSEAFHTIFFLFAFKKRRAGKKRERGRESTCARGFPEVGGSHVGVQTGVKLV
jgi:hypothetical protein